MIPKFVDLPGMKKNATDEDYTTSEEMIKEWRQKLEDKRWSWQEMNTPSLITSSGYLAIDAFESFELLQWLVANADEIKANYPMFLYVLMLNAQEESKTGDIEEYMNMLERTLKLEFI